MSNWEKTDMGNKILKGDGFYISYQDFSGLAGTVFANLGGPDGDAPETALCKGNMFYVLNGDFREEYEKAINEGFDKCFEIYGAYADNFDSSWTTKEEDSDEH